MKLYITTLFLGFTLLANAQHKINGTITDSQNNPLFGVEVYIEELQKGTATNEQGYYELINLPSTPIKLNILYIGFEKQVKTVTLNSTETVIDFVLKETVFKMDEVIISTPFNKLQSENVMKVEKATIEQLKNKGAATLIDGLSTIAGVSQVSTGTGIGKPVIRGLRGNRVLVYSQGIRLENQQFGDEHGLGIDEFSIESVEVIKGPASLLYGSDALGGVLYFNPLKFAKSNKIESSINHTLHSNTHGNNTSIAIKKSYNNWKFLANGSYTAHGDYQVPSEEKVTNTRYNETIFNSGIGYNNSNLTATLRLNHNQSTIGIPEDIGVQSSSKKPLIPNQELTNSLVSLNSIFYLTDSKITSTIGYTRNNRKEFEEEHGHEEEHEGEEEEEHDEHDEHDEHEEEVHAALDLNLKTFTYDLKWHLPKKTAFETIIGIQGLTQTNKNFGEEILIPDANINDIGILATSSYDWKDQSLLGGIRYDSRSISTEEHIVQHEDEEHVFNAIDKSFNNISVSLGYKTDLFKTLTTRINMASGFKAPNLAELTSNGVHHGTNRFEIGSNDLKSEKNFQTDIAIEYDSEHLEVFVNGFYNHINNYIFISPTGEIEDDNFVYEYTQDQAKLYGGEFGLHLHPHPLDWLHFYSGFEFVIGKQNNGSYLPLIPANKLTNTLRTEFYNSKLFQKTFASISLEHHFEQNKLHEFESKTDQYSLINLNTGGKITFDGVEFNINFSINNLFNKSYVSHLSRLKNDGIQNIGRNFITSITVNL